MLVCRSTLFACAVLLMIASRAQGNEPGVRIARIDPQVVHLEVLDQSDIRFSRLSHTPGISQTRVTSIVQDERGFLWFATLYGLNRYDGYGLRRFKHEDADPHSVSDSLVRSLFKDREGRLWIGSQGFLDRYDPATETFIHYPLNIPAVSDSDLLPRHMSQDNDGMLWLATSVGLCRLEPTSGRTQCFRHRADDPTSLSSDFIQSSGVDRAGMLWVATREGLDAFDPATDRVTMHVPIRELREPSEMSFYEDRSGTFWIRQSSGEGLATLDRNTGVVTRYSFAQRPAGADTLTGVSSILEDATGQLWIGTHSDGLLKLDVQHRRALRYRNDPFNPESLAENRITTLSLDREGDIWVGLGASEPNHFRSQSAPFRTVPFDAANPYNLGEHLINTLYEDSTGALWVGTTGALNRLDRDSGRYQRIEVPNTSNSDVLSIIEAQPDVFWVGTSGQGLERMDLKSRTSRLYRHRPGDPTSLASDTVLALRIDPRGTLWAATIDGLSSFDAATDQFHSFRYGAEGSAIYTSIAQDPRGMFWISGPSGVLEFDPLAGKFVAVPQLRPAKGYAVTAAADGEIWAGTQGGLYRYNPATRAVRVYSERDGLASIAISCVLEDTSGNIWMSTTEGISRLLISSNQIRNYSVEDGLPGRDLTGWSACSRSRSGRLNFGGFSGGVTFDPRAVVDDPYAPTVTLTGLELAGVPVTLGPGSPLTRAIGYTHELYLSSNQRNFGIEFTALSFRSPPTNRYRYRLDDLDSGWHEVGAERRVANYTTLPPGSYTFRVQGATNRGPWSEPGVALRITIAAPWWARWEFRALLAAIVLGLGIWIYRYRLQQITRALEIRFDERLRERTRIARDLHDSLLQGFTGLTLKFHALAYSLGGDNPIRARIEENLRHARELMEETRARVRDLRSQDEHANLEELLQEYADTLPGSGTTRFELRVVGVPRRIDSMAFEEILLIGREAISNALAHAAATRVEVELTYSNRDLTLRVSDDGKGMDANTLQAGREGHWGLQGMRERAQLLGASLEVWSRPGEGTDIQLVVSGMIAYQGSRSRKGGPRAW